MCNFHCQNGHKDLCWAARRDGVTCPDDSCDVDDGLVEFKNPVELNEEEIGLIVGALNIAVTVSGFTGGKKFPHKKVNKLQEKLLKAKGK